MISRSGRHLSSPPTYVIGGRWNTRSMSGSAAQIRNHTPPVLLRPRLTGCYRQSARVAVCRMPACISQKPHAPSLRNFLCTPLLAVTLVILWRTIHYVLPLLWWQSKLLKLVDVPVCQNYSEPNSDLLGQSVKKYLKIEQVRIGSGGGWENL